MLLWHWHNRGQYPSEKAMQHNTQTGLIKRFRYEPPGVNALLTLTFITSPIKMQISSGDRYPDALSTQSPQRQHTTPLAKEHVLGDSSFCPELYLKESFTALIVRDM